MDLAAFFEKTQGTGIFGQSLIQILRQKQPCMFPEEDDSEKFLVFFQIDRIRPLVGSELKTK